MEAAKIVAPVSCLAVLSLLLFPQQGLSQAKAAPTGDSLVYVVPVQNEIDLGLLAFIKRALKEATEANAKTVVFEINTFGGRVDAAVGIRDLILDAKIPTIAFINKRAISAGALISLSCTKIYMNDAGTIGAATPIQLGGGEAKPVEAKVVSYFASEMRATAEKTKRPGDIAAGMVDPDLEIQGIKTKGAPLTLTTSRAIELKIADGLAHTIDEALNQSGTVAKTEAQRTITLKTNWAEVIARFVTGSIVSSLLITLGILLIFFELKAPGFGVAGAGAILCFALYFFGHLITNLAGFEEILLFVIGLGLIALEIFVLPGHAVSGIIGIVCVVAAVIMAGIPKHVPFDFDMPWIAQAFKQVAASFVLSAVGIVAILIWGPKSRLTHRLFLEQTVPAAATTDSDLIRKRGTALTDLRPAGKALVGSKKLDVVTEGDYIERGKPVEIIEIDGPRIVVKPVEEP